jgi:hypothetical protein
VNLYGFYTIVNVTAENNRNTAGSSLIYTQGMYSFPESFYANTNIINSTFKNNNVNLDIYVSNMYSFSEIYNSTFIGEQTVLSNRGYTNITSTTIKDSANASRYVINNFGSLGLENNTFDNPTESNKTLDFFMYYQLFRAQKILTPPSWDGSAFSTVNVNVSPYLVISTLSPFFGTIHLSSSSLVKGMLMIYAAV